MSIVATKTAAEILDFTIDWSTRGLGADTIATSTWAYTGTSGTITLDDDSIADPATSTTIWVSGGTTGAIYTITNTVVTIYGRTLVESFKLEVIAERLL